MKRLKLKTIAAAAAAAVNGHLGDRTDLIRRLIKPVFSELFWFDHVRGFFHAVLFFSGLKEQTSTTEPTFDNLP